MTRTRRLLVLLAMLSGLLLTTAGACDTGAAPSAPPATVAPGDDGQDDGSDDSTQDGADDSGDDSDDGGSDDESESEGPDDGGPSGRGNTGESR